MHPQKDSVIVFDIDGTLTDSVALHQRAFEAALRSFPFPALRTDWASYRHHSDSAILHEAWEEAGFGKAPDMREVERRFRAAFDTALGTESIREIPGSSTLLAELDQSRWVACFATGSFRYGALRKLGALSCPIDLDLLITATECQTREDIVSASITCAQSKHSIRDVQRVLSIGDGIWDLRTANTLGLAFLGVGQGSSADRLRAENACVVPDLAISVAMLEAMG